MSPTDALPPFLYGTAWKEERTGPLVELALRQGFRGIDTANQCLRSEHIVQSAGNEPHQSFCGCGVNSSVRGRSDGWAGPVL